MTRGPARWPAEWERHDATWLCWPQNADTWPGHLDEVRREYAEIVRALQGRETVRLLVADTSCEDAARSVLRSRGIDPDPGIEFLHVATDDAWIRDYGPLFVHDAAGRPTPLHFGFDAWGGKYPPWKRDASAARRMLAERGLASRQPGFVLEGGSIDGNGAGTVLTTESCLLNPNRERGRTREQMEGRLAEWLGTRQVVWLADGIRGDDTDGHVDDLSRFVDATTVVTVVAEPASDDAPALEENRRRLLAAQDADGRRLDVVALPMPPPHVKDGLRCPASHANFYLANGVVLVPTFGVASDARALAILRESCSGREVVGIPCATLVMGLGAVHCLTQQEPAPATAAEAPQTP